MKRRRGFVLIVVVYALVLLAALVAGGFFASLQEARAGRNASATLRTRLAAGSAIATTLAGWDPRVANALLPDSSYSPAAAPVPGVATSIQVRRLSPRLFLLRATATDSSGAAQSLERIGRLRALELAPAASVRARFVDPALAGSVVGVDQVPPGWACVQPNDTIAPFIIQPGSSDSAFFDFGGRSWAWVAAWAASIQPGGDSLPVTYAAQDLAIVGARTLGAVIVEGNLTLSGGAEVVGLVLVRGTLKLGAGGATIRGQVVASQVIAVQGYTPIQPVVIYSSCAVLRAALARALPEPLWGMPASRIY